MNRRRAGNAPVSYWMTAARGAIGLSAIWLFANCAALVRAENWPGWRGPARSGVTPEEDLPTTWSDSEGLLWKASLPGQGISNPIVWGDRVFVTASDGPKQDELHLVCFDLASGRTVWHERYWGTAPTLFHAEKSGMAVPSPITDGKRLFAFYGTGDLVCVDLDGSLLWQRSLAAEYGAFENRFAASSSPLLYGDDVILQCDHYGASYAIAVDQRSGATHWKSERPECWLSWASPQLVRDPASGLDELILVGSEKVDGVDPRTGRPLWTLGGLAHECVPTPVVGQGKVYVTSGPNGSTIAIRPGGRGDISKSHVDWTQTRATSFVPSGILVDKFFIVASDQGIGTCVDVTSGQVLWRKRLGGAFTASPVGTPDRVYFTNEEGETLVLSVGPEYRELTRNQLKEPVFASPAISQGRILIRGARQLFCIGR